MTAWTRDCKRQDVEPGVESRHEILPRRPEVHRHERIFGYGPDLLLLINLKCHSKHRQQLRPVKVRRLRRRPAEKDHDEGQCRAASGGMDGSRRASG